jgi:ABC-type nitrate/sulfonate/bicarbonate transport system permease component
MKDGFALGLMFGLILGMILGHYLVVIAAYMPIE